MPLKYTLLLFSVLSSCALLAQTPGVSGTVFDPAERQPVRGATVRLSQTSDSAFHFSVVTDNAGAFRFPNLVSGRYDLRVSSIGYQAYTARVQYRGVPLAIDTIWLEKGSSLLDSVIVEAIPPPVRQRNDTLEYSASRFKVNPDANVDDMIKKMPGITVENGTVKSGGEDVQKVTVDGRDFFGDDATAALKNLPADVVEKVQVFDRLSDQSRFTGFDDGNSVKAINIVTKAGMRNGQFGRVFGGYGTDDRFSAGGNMSLFNGDRRISLVGNFNNINQQNFASEDLLGVTSSGGRGGGNRGGGRGGPGGGGGGGGRRGGSAGNFLVSQQAGISHTAAAGVNFSDRWGRNTEVTGSYFFNNNSNNRDELVNRETFLSGDSSQLYGENSQVRSNNTNHRLNMRIEYKIDSANILQFTPNLSFQNNDAFTGITGVTSFKGNDATSQSVSSNSRNSGGYNIRNGLLYRHAFQKRGRTISFNLNTGFNQRQGETYLTAINTFYSSGERSDSLRQFTDQSSDGQQWNANIAYTEPLSGKSQLQLNYNPSWSRSNSDQQTFQFDAGGGKYSLFDSSLSNRYDNEYTTQNGGLSYRLGDRDNMFSAGVSYQYARLSGEQVFPFVTTVNRSFGNLLPNLMLRRKLSARSSIRLYYRSSTEAPSIDQLQQVVDNSNPLFLRTGNPALEQEYSHRIVTRYSFTNSNNGQSFLANLFLQQTSDYIANATYIAAKDSVISQSITLYRGAQITRPVNLQGYRSLRSFFTFGLPVKPIKSNLNLNAGYNYAKTPGLIDSRLNRSNTQTINLGAVMSSNISEYVDFNISYSAYFNRVRNSIQPSLNNDYFNQSAGLDMNLLSKRGWFVQNSITNQSYSGLSDGFNQSFWLWNAGAGKKFLKDQSGELRLTVFDLLKQNRSITRTATETYVEDVQTQVLQQYFMLTFSYRLRNFGSARGARRS